MYIYIYVKECICKYFNETVGMRELKYGMKTAITLSLWYLQFILGSIQPDSSVSDFCKALLLFTISPSASLVIVRKITMQQTSN